MANAPSVRSTRRGQILFFNIDGGIMFKIFVGRDEKRELKADQFDAFRKLAERLGATVEA